MLDNLLPVKEGKSKKILESKLSRDFFANVLFLLYLCMLFK